MPELFDKDGNQVDGALTPAEVETQKQEAIKTATEPLQAQITEAQRQLEGFKDKDLNFGHMRKDKEALESKVAELSDQLSKIPETIQQQFIQQQAAKDIEATIAKIADGDAELQKKIEHHFKETLKGVETKDEKELAEKLRRAWVLAIEKQGTPDPLAGIISSAAASDGPAARASNPDPLPAEVQAVAKNLGISDEDVKKFDKPTTH